MNRAYTITMLARLHASEWIRLRFFQIVIFFSILFIGFSHLLSSLTFSVQDRILFDFGTAGLEMGLILISSLIGSHSIQREIDKKTLFVLLSRPIPRSSIVLGSWLSLVILNFLFSFGFLMSLLISFRELSSYGGLLIAAYNCLLKAVVISSFAVAMGILVRPILALAAAVSYWVLCYSLPDIQYFVGKLKDDFLIRLFGFFDYLLPQFYRYNWKSYYYITNLPSSGEIFWATMHSLGWTVLWLFAAAVFFRRKEIV